MLNSRFNAQPIVATAGDAVSPPSPLGDGPVASVTMPSFEEIPSVRGVTDAAAEVEECACPAFCERDHANE